LERGITHDPAFQQWASKVCNNPSAQDTADQRTRRMSLEGSRKDLVIDVIGVAGKRVLSYNVYRAWVSEYQALPEADGHANAVAIQAIKLENEGWGLVADQTEPE
jgi:phage tail-like protein